MAWIIKRVTVRDRETHGIIGIDGNPIYVEVRIPGPKCVYRSPDFCWMFWSDQKRAVEQQIAFSDLVRVWLSLAMVPCLTLRVPLLLLIKYTFIWVRKRAEGVWSTKAIVFVLSCSFVRVVEGLLQCSATQWHNLCPNALVGWFLVSIRWLAGNNGASWRVVWQGPCDRDQRCTEYTLISQKNIHGQFSRKLLWKWNLV
jgi:hypothetical protein